MRVLIVLCTIAAFTDCGHSLPSSVPNSITVYTLPVGALDSDVFCVQEIVSRKCMRIGEMRDIFRTFRRAE